MLQRLITALAQVKASNTSGNLPNEVLCIEQKKLLNTGPFLAIYCMQ